MKDEFDYSWIRWLKRSIPLTAVGCTRVKNHLAIGDLFFIVPLRRYLSNVLLLRVLPNILLRGVIARALQSFTYAQNFILKYQAMKVSNFLYLLYPLFYGKLGFVIT